MVVMITVEDLRQELRAGDTTEETSLITRRLGYAAVAVEQYAPDAPDTVHDEAAIRLASYLYDQPTSAPRSGFANAIRNSGAARMLLPYRIHRAGSTAEAIADVQSVIGTVGNPVTGLGITGDTLTVTFADGSTDTLTLPAGGGGGIPTGTADLLVERLGSVDNPTLPDNRVWLGTGIIIPDGVHVLMVDAGQASDDYHLVDWDAIKTHVSVVAGTESMAGEFETFKGDAFTDLRIGHGADYEVLLANDSTNPLTLLHVHFERLLAPVGSGTFGTDQTARDSAAAAAATADMAQQGTVDNATAISGLDIPTDSDVDARIADWAETGNMDAIPNAKIGNAVRGHRVYVQTTEPASGQTGDVWIRDLTTAHPMLYEYGAGSWNLDYEFLGGRIHFTNSAHNIAMTNPSANTGDILLELVSGTLKLYRRLNASSSPYWQLLGTVAGGGGSVVDWAKTGNSEAIPADKLVNASGSSIPTYTSLGVGELNGTRTAFAFDDTADDAIVAAWANYNALVMKFLNTATGGTAHHRIVRIPTVGALSGGTQDVFHFDYGTHADTDDHDGRLLILETGTIVSVALSTTQTFPAGETVTVYGES